MRANNKVHKCTAFSLVTCAHVISAIFTYAGACYSIKIFFTLKIDVKMVCKGIKYFYTLLQLFKVQWLVSRMRIESTKYNNSFVSLCAFTNSDNIGRHNLHCFLRWKTI